MTTPTSSIADSGRRERKKAATRAGIAAAALDLFLEQGFERVGIRDIADRADVAVATVFAHFSGKEALVFDGEEERARRFASPIHMDGTPPPTIEAVLTILEERARSDHRDGAAHRADPRFAAFTDLVRKTPQLDAFRRETWRRQIPTLAAMLGAHLPTPAATLLATFVMEGQLVAGDSDDPGAALDALYVALRSGFTPES